ncbi:MAG: DUF559 domain-containing protein [Fibrobacter sp.]|nr:DUF559 domain-containing protein [Fibrobacter sp.]
MKKTIHLIVDFNCNECKLVIEIDGYVHENQKVYEEGWSIFLHICKHITIVIFTNLEIENKLRLVVNKTHYCRFCLHNTNNLMPIATAGIV